MMKKLLLMLLPLLFSACVHGSVYKCVGENGRTRYQATDCGGVVVNIDETPPPAAVQSTAVTGIGSGFGGGRHAVRSEAKKNLFKAIKPCPSTGEGSGPCPGYVVDHIKPLACGGADDPRNMQWQTVSEGKAKDQWERVGCQLKAGGRFAAVRFGAAAYSSGGSRVFIGPRGGRYTISADGHKRYLRGD